MFVSSGRFAREIRMTPQDNIVGAGRGRTQSFMPGEMFTWKATGGSIDFAELHLGPQVGPPEHIHHAHDEAYYILEGNYRFKVGEDVADVDTGAFILIPRGTPHAWTNIGGMPGRVAVMFIPGGMAGYFDELAPLLPDLMSGLGDMGKVDPLVLASADKIMARYQYELVGPPLQ